MTNFLNSLNTLFDRLTEPNARITDQQDRQRSRLLSRMLLLTLLTAIIIVPIAMSLEETIDDDPEYLVISVGLVIAVGLYLVNRRGHVNVAAVGFACLTFVIFSFGSFIPGASGNLLALAFVTILLTAIFFPLRYVVPTAAVIIGIGAIFNALNFSYSTALILYSLILSSILLITFVRHQEWLERLRRRELEESNAKLVMSEASLQSANADLEHRVNERTRDLANKNIELASAWEAAKQADHVKSQFLASMSHELRTPLNAILNFTEFVNVGMLGPVNERQQDALSKSLESGRHLLSLINDVLDVTKIESGMMSLFVEENIDLPEIINSGVTMAQTLLKDKPVVLRTEIDANLPSLTADKRRIRQVLLNLLSNACKFTEEGSVMLRVKNEGDTIQFSVIDTGPGIAKEDQVMIFEPFKQTAKGIQHAGGTGLGLPISLRLVEAHYGRLWVESEPNQGATFHVRLPVNSPELLKLINGVAV